MKKAIKLTALVVCIVLAVFSSLCVFADELPISNEPYTYDAETGTFTFTNFAVFGFETLSAGLFQGAENMTVQVVIDDPGIKAIGEQAFLNCFRLEKITIPETVTEIHDSAFWGCPSDMKIYGAKNSVAEAFAKEHGFTFKEKSSDDVSTEGTVSGGIAVTILGVGIVFLILVILCVVLKVFEIVFSSKKTAAPVQKVSAPVPTAAAAEDDTELVAVITAAIAASLNTSTYNLKIKSVRRLGSSWNRAGVHNFNNIF